MSKIREILSAWRTIQPEYESGDGEALDDAFEKDVAALEALQREAVIAELEAMADSLRSFGVRDLILARIAALKAEAVQLHKPYINNSSAENGTEL